MTILKRTVALILMVLSAAGVVLGIAGVVGVWVVRPPLTERTDHAFGRVETALDQTGDTLRALDLLLKRAAENLKEVRETAPRPGGNVANADTLRQKAARQVTESLIPGLGDVRPKLLQLIETTAVANSILGDLQEMPAGTLPYLDRDRLSKMDAHVTELSSATQDLANVFGAPAGRADADADQVISRIEDALTRVTALIQEYRDKVEEVRGRAYAIHAQVHAGIQWAAVVATFVLLWFAVAQVSLFAHAWSWLRAPIAKVGYVKSS
jgi:hypothetical protein